MLKALGEVFRMLPINGQEGPCGLDTFFAEGPLQVAHPINLRAVLDKSMRVCQRYQV